jgi:hypothetical protein
VKWTTKPSACITVLTCLVIAGFMIFYVVFMDYREPADSNGTPPVIEFPVQLSLSYNASRLFLYAGAVLSFFFAAGLLVPASEPQENNPKKGAVSHAPKGAK